MCLRLFRPSSCVLSSLTIESLGFVTMIARVWKPTTHSSLQSFVYSEISSTGISWMMGAKRLLNEGTALQDFPDSLYSGSGRQVVTNNPDVDVMDGTDTHLNWNLKTNLLLATGTVLGSPCVYILPVMTFKAGQANTLRLPITQGPVTVAFADASQSQLSSNPSGMSISGQSLLWTPTDSQAGQFIVALRVTNIAWGTFTDVEFMARVVTAATVLPATPSLASAPAGSQLASGPDRLVAYVGVPFVIQVTSTHPTAGKHVHIEHSTLPIGAYMSAVHCAEGELDPNHLSYVQSYSVGRTCTTTMSWTPTVRGETVEMMWTATDLQGQSSMPYSLVIDVQEPPPVITSLNPSTGSTDGAYSIVVTGTGFGARPQPATVTVGGSTCAWIAQDDTSVTCTMPAGQGSNRPVQVSFSDGSSSGLFDFDYLRPVISGISPGMGATSGGYTINLGGSNFGTGSPTPQSVTVGVVPVTIVGTPTHSSVVVTIPEGFGANLPVVITVEGQTSVVAEYFSYTPPSLGTPTWTSAPAAGGAILTLSGLNFGAADAPVTIRVAGNICTHTPGVHTHSHTVLECIMPPGEGASQPISVTVGGQAATGTAQVMRYDSPVLTSVVALQVPYTDGGAEVMLTGLNFGSGDNTEVFLDTDQLNLVSANDTHITAVLSEGQDIHDFVVVTSGQSSSTLSFTYEPPAISLVSPQAGPTAGASYITITGTSFGTVDTTVTVGGADCPIFEPPHAHDEIICNLPAGAGATNDVVVTVSSQSSAPVNYGYRRPSVTGMQPSTPSTAGGQVTINGLDFSLRAVGSVTVDGVACPVPSVNTYTSTRIVCDLPAGQGGAHEIVVTVDGQDSDPFVFSYGVPVINTVTATPNKSTQGGASLQLDGANFGASAFGVVTLDGFELTCGNYAQARIVCVLPAGNGTALPIVVTVAGQASPAKLFSYDPPSITSVGYASAPVLGGTEVTVVGQSFDTPQGTVTVGGIDCPVVEWSYTIIKCTLPEGKSSNQLVVVSAVTTRASTQLKYVNYNAPSITSVGNGAYSEGAAPGSPDITIVGNNFGATGLANAVTVNGNVCVIRRWSNTQVECAVPPLEGATTIAFGHGPVVVNVGNQRNPGETLLALLPPVLTVINPNTGPTNGGYFVTVVGHSFGDGIGLVPTVTIGGSPCNSIDQITHTSLRCEVPEGTTIKNVDVTVLGRTSNWEPFFYFGPQVTGANFATMAQTTASAGGGDLLTITGNNFGPEGTATVTIGGKNCPVVSQTHSQVVCTVPSGGGLNQQVHLRSDGAGSNRDVTIDYGGPVITSVEPQNLDGGGAARITLTGQNFGNFDYASVTVGDEPCSTVSWGEDAFGGVANTIVCELPEGNGANLPVYVTVADQTSPPASYTYKAPEITSLVGPVGGGPTTGNFQLDVFGTSFSDEGNVYVIDAGSGGVIDECLVVSISAYQNTQVRCLFPPGSGSVLVGLLVGAQWSNNETYSYARPELSSIDPSNGPTVGSTQVVIMGSNFGTFGTATVGGVECLQTGPASSWSHSRVSCVLPAGQGAAVEVALSSGTLGSINTLDFHYDLPAVTHIIGGSTDGEVITLVGTNFGSASATVDVVISSLPCSVTAWNHTTIECALAPGVGVNLDVTVSVDGQQEDGAPRPIFSYNAPNILSVTGCTDTMADTSNCPISGLVTITVTGSNFGSAMDDPRIFVGNNECSGVTFNGDGALQCLLPEGIDSGNAVVVTVGGQSSSSARTVSYAGPVITALTLRFDMEVTDFGDRVADNRGGQRVVFEGTNFKPFAESDPSVWFGIGGALTYQCTGVVATDTEISCNLDAGVGRNLSFVVNDTRQLSDAGTDMLSFLQPTIVNGTLRESPNGSPGNNVAGSETEGEFLAFKVQHAGSLASRLTVRYGTRASGVFEQECLQVVTRGYDVSNDTVEVECKTSPGIGSDLVFQVTALNYVSEPGFDTYNYPVAPVVDSVQGCSDAFPLTAECATTGSTLGDPVILTILGSSFAARELVVRIGAYDCPLVQPASGSNTIYCSLPPGVGVELPVVVAVNSLFSRPRYFLSYSAPTITTVSGCTADGANTVECERAGNQEIVISGTNFGPSRALVLIDGKLCTSVAHDTINPHSIIRCRTPAGTGLDSSVQIVQGGQVSEPAVTVSYRQCDAGMYQASDTDYACTDCAEGTYSPSTGQLICLACPSGRYANTTGNSECLVCQPGRFAEGNANECTECSPGRFAVNFGQSDCNLCEPGTFTPAEGAITCDSCITGRATSLFGQTDCTDCTAGTFAALERTATCEQCPAGTYSDPRAAACVNCAPGKSQLFSGQSSCTPCALGTFMRSSGQPQCIECDGGTFANITGLSQCYQCPAGKHSQKRNGATSCVECNVGQYMPTPGQTSCLDCEPGSFQNSTGSSQCEPCGIGRYQTEYGSEECDVCLPGSTALAEGSSICAACEPGRYKAIGMSTCAACAAGRFQSATGETSCEPCPVGRATNAEGQLVCEQCSVGAYASHEGTEVCSRCPAGSIAASAGLTECTPCAPGSYIESEAQGACKQCPGGRYQPFSNQTECLLCDAGRFVSTSSALDCADCDVGYFAVTAGSVACERCPVGSFSNDTGLADCRSCEPGSAQSAGTAAACDECVPGTYMGASGQAVCLICPAGSYAPDNGAKECIPCEAGRFQPQPGQADCNDCPVGRATAAVGQASCLVCTAGTFSNDTGAESCGRCATGRFTSDQEASACSDCPLGTYADTTGAFVCKDCPVGSYQNTTGEDTCRLCEAGRSQPQTRQSSCRPCLAGRFQGIQGQGSCSLCEVGKISQAGASTCDSCLPGRFTSAAGTSVCEECDIGEFAATSAAISCEACPIGRFQDETGDFECEVCPPGTYQDDVGSNGCIPCERGSANSFAGSNVCPLCRAGTYANETGMEACLPCPAGFFCEAAAIEPEPCAPGTYTNLDNQAFCAPCPVGTYSSINGSTICPACLPGYFTGRGASVECEMCGAGRFASGTGSIQCLDCEPGTFSEEGAGLCTFCAQGRYQDDAGQRLCKQCPLGRFAQVVGLEQCDPCPLGSYGDNTGLVRCTLCDQGYFQDQPGQITCAPCPPGFNMAVSGASFCTACTPGRFSDDTANVECTQCGLGKYQLEPGSVECDLCPAGSYTLVPGSPDCEPCVKGTYNSVPGSTFCLPCEVGKAQPLEGQEQCEFCEVGLFANNERQARCFPCELGSFNNETGARSCEPCAPGRFQSRTEQSDCDACPLGRYNLATGQAECSGCPTGRFGDELGQLECTACPQGKAQEITGKTVCTDCPIARYAATLGSEKCLACGTGTFGALPGSLNCTLCPAGSYQNRELQTSCQLCEPGSYSQEGQALCQTCPSGTVAFWEGSSACEACPDFSVPNFPKTECTCDEGYYFPDYEAGAALVCEECPVGADCSQAGSKWSTLESAPGFWRASQASLQFYLCLRPEHCAGGPAPAVSDPDSSATCNGNRGGVLCSQCLDGYKEAAGGGCEKCPDGSGGWTLAIFVILLVFGALWLQVYVILRAGQPMISKATEEVEADHVVHAGIHDDNLVHHRGSGRHGKFRDGNFESEESDVEAPASPEANYPTLAPGNHSNSSGYSTESDDGMYNEPEQTTTTTTKVTTKKLVFDMHAPPVPYSGGQRVVLPGAMKTPSGSDMDQRDPPPPPPPPPALETTSNSSRSSDQRSNPIELPPPPPAPLTMHDLSRPVIVHDHDLKDEVFSEASDFDEDQYFYTNHSAIDSNTHEPPKPSPNATYKLKILVGFIQIVTNLATGLELRWPTSFKSFVQTFDFLNVDWILSNLVSTDCISSETYYYKFSMIVAVPPFIFTLIFFVFLLPRIMNCCKYKHDTAKQRIQAWLMFWMMSLYLLFLIYPSVSSTVLRHYICKRIDQGDGTQVSYLLKDMRVECYSDVWMSYAWLAAILALLYPVGIPLFFFAMLYRHRANLDKPRRRAQLGFLYAGYKKTYWWFEMVDMSHKLLLVSALAFFPKDAQLPVGMFVACVYTMVLLRLKPYVREEDDFLHLLVQCELIICLIAGHVYNNLELDDFGGRYDTFMTITLIGIFLMVCAVFLYLALGIIRTARTNSIKSKQQQTRAELLALDGKFDESQFGINMNHSFAGDGLAPLRKGPSRKRSNVTVQSATEREHARRSTDSRAGSRATTDTNKWDV